MIVIGIYKSIAKRIKIYLFPYSEKVSENQISTKRIRLNVFICKFRFTAYGFVE